MDKTNVHRAIQKVAEKEGISQEQVVADMEQSIEEMWQDAYDSGDKRKIAFWESLPHEGEKHTIYEFIDFLINFVHNMR